VRKLAILALILSSCDAGKTPYKPMPMVPSPHDETGPDLEEKGKVLETVFRMGSSTTTTSHAPGYKGTISKSMWDDPWGVHDKRIEVPSTQTSNTVTVQDQFAVVFQCQHGKFLIESLGKQSTAHKLWEKLKEGDAVSIRYREIYRVFPDGERRLLKYDFIDADPVK